MKDSLDSHAAAEAWTDPRVPKTSFIIALPFS